MKYILASLIFVSPVAAARCGLLRVDGPAFVDKSVSGTKTGARRELVEEDFNLVFRQLFGYADFSLSASANLSLSMASQLSLSMPSEFSETSSGTTSGSSGDETANGGNIGGEGSSVAVPNDGESSTGDQATQSPVDDTESSSSGQAAGSSTQNANESAAEDPSGDKGETGKKAMIGVLSVAGIALVGVAVSRKLKKDAASASDGDNSSVPSEPSIDGNMDNVPL